MEDLPRQCLQVSWATKFDDVTTHHSSREYELYRDAHTLASLKIELIV